MSVKVIGKFCCDEQRKHNECGKFCNLRGSKPNRNVIYQKKYGCKNSPHKRKFIGQLHNKILFCSKLKVNRRIIATNYIRALKSCTTLIADETEYSGRASEAICNARSTMTAEFVTPCKTTPPSFTTALKNSIAR